MIYSKILEPENKTNLENNLLKKLANSEEFSDKRVINSPRAVGDIVESSSRKEWMLKLCDALDIFYPKEIDKIGRRLERFKAVREFWENKV